MRKMHRKPEFYENRDDTITNPVLIAEVLSESTRDYDRGQKFLLYRAIFALREYVLVDQYRYHVEHFSQNREGKWVLSEYDHPEDLLTIPGIDFKIPLKAFTRKWNSPRNNTVLIESCLDVISAKAWICKSESIWIPAFAGMTQRQDSSSRLKIKTRINQISIIQCDSVLVGWCFGVGWI